jgi:putative ABC transport system permease protein
VTWLSHRFWQREFGGDMAAVGRPLRIERAQSAEELRIVGILGPEVASFDLNNSPPDLVAPQRGPPQVGPNRLSFPLVLAPIGVSVDQAAQQISAALQAVAPAADGRPREVRLRALSAAQTAGGRPTAKVLLTGALLVLLLASMNLFHLLLSRGMTRAQEVATRASLGASRWRITRVFLVDSLLLGTAGISLGLAVGKGISLLISANVPQWPTAGRNLALVPMLFDVRVIAFAVVLGLVASVAGGLWPAWLALRRPMAIHQRTAGGVSLGISGRLSRGILASELTVATMVIVGAVFVGLGIHRYLNQPLGYEYEDRLRVFVGAPDGGPAAGQDAAAVVRAIRAVTGVREAGFERSVSRTRDVEVVDRAVDTKEISALGVTAGYFEAWGMHLQQGRWFEAGEFLDPASSVVVDDRFARLAWPNADPIGATVRAAGSLRRVVGVVQSRRELLDRELPPALYVPAPESAGRDTVVAWAPASDLADMSTRITAAVQAAVPGATVTVTRMTFEGLFLRGIGEAQFQAPIVTTFGVLSVILAGIGVFGLVSYLVEQRTREFGIRMALGAKLQDIWRTVMRESIQPTLIGLLLGSAGALALESVVQSSVFGWKSSGPTAVAIVAVGLLMVAIIAALIPAGRAARVDPATTLRAE